MSQFKQNLPIATPEATPKPEPTEMTGATPEVEPDGMVEATPQASPATSAEPEVLPKTDVVIIGLGAAGGIAAYVFTDAGLNVVGLEAGPRLEAADFLSNYDELKGYFFSNWTGEPKANHEVPTWRPTPDAEKQDPAFNIKMMNAVGGTSVHYTAQSWRMREDDFKIYSSTVERYGEDKLPDGHALADWPVTYDDMEPYYDKVEYLIGVSGAGGMNPFESPRARDYPMPPLQRTAFTELAAEGMAEMGYDPFDLPAAINSEPYDGRDACSYCGYCTGHGCWNNSKSSTLVSAIRKAEDTGLLEVRPNSRVFRILTDESGNASGVEYRNEAGEMVIQPAGVVVLAAYTYENTRLLLLSESEQFPNGLANNSGQVGKYFMGHALPSVNAFFPGMNFNGMSGTASQNTSMDNLNGDNFDHTDLDFIRGSIVQAGAGESNPIGASRNIPPGVPTWGAEYKAWLKENSLGVAAITTQQEVLPYHDNFMDLDPDVVDPDGVPVVRVTFEIKDNEYKAWEYISARITEILETMGAEATWENPVSSIPVNSHAYGGARAGDDPAVSVVDRYCLAHEVPNLAIMGASAFPSTSGYNPTETLQAWAWLSAEYIAENFDDIAV